MTGKEENEGVVRQRRGFSDGAKNYNHHLNGGGGAVGEEDVPRVTLVPVPSADVIRHVLTTTTTTTFIHRIIHQSLTTFSTHSPQSPLIPQSPHCLLIHHSSANRTHIPPALSGSWAASVALPL